MRWISSSLKRKLSTLLLFSVLIPLLALGLFAYNMAATTTEEKAKQSGTSILRQMSTNLEFIVHDVENMSLFMIGQKDIQKFLSSDDEDPVKQTQMIEFLSNLVYSKSYISDITIYPLNKYPPVSNATIFDTGLSGDDDERIQHYQSQTKFWTARYETDTASGPKQVISLIRPIRSLNSFRQLGTLVISLDEKAISQILRQANLPGSGDVVLTNSEGNILSSSNAEKNDGNMKDMLPGFQLEGRSGWLNYGEGDNKQTILYDSVADMGWTLTGIMPFAEYRNQNSYVLKLMAIVIVVSVLVVSILVLYFVQRVTNPLIMLTQFMKHSNPEEPLQKYPVETMDEVGQLVRSYNKLSDRIAHLTEQVKQEESYKKEADMQALQAQINPHFLYNTLSSIHWMALMNKDEKIADMVGSLSDFLRFSLNKGEEFCSVEQEVAHAMHYSNIQSIRFPGKFKLQMDIDPALSHTRMLKLLLQPLIENALIHGIQKQPAMGEIKVSAKLESEWMHFMVEDTGVGMDDEKLNEIKRELQAPHDQKMDRERLERGSYGLRNVNRRLHLHYGLQSGLIIESEINKGTVVSFSIPTDTLGGKDIE
ncbi:sensor histidine kinase [Paenibacillus sp. GSMTC-2017]|uniref:cache domain-containing sensor histidine kinase n=1 Tax=Paenibacillus sp. GSMTC-2017 TaxID=2794350 RepID=UPI0018D9348D|nr:sensor histidine kinase [Paenibacillus sp. GSMTC-2017]MBH5320116.1 sensor histidine kinase [Paenibacillus sp. GSMTC-2017]